MVALAILAISLTVLLDANVAAIASVERIEGLFDLPDFEPGRLVQKGPPPQAGQTRQKLIALARSRGLPAAIFRPGAISGDSKTGMAKTDTDYLARMMR